MPDHPSPFHWKNLAHSGWLYPLLACFLLVLLFSSKKINSYDLGTHLAAGKWIVQHHAFPDKDSFTYTQGGRDYLDPHSLYQVTLYCFQEVFGYSSLLFLHMTLVLLVFGLLGWRLHLSQSPPALAALLLLASAVLMERRFVIRPEVFSWFFLSSTLLILELRAVNKNYLYLLPLLQFFWVNTEGLFMLGWFVMGAYILSGWFHQKRWDPKLVRYSLLSLGAGLLNPYFWKGLLFPALLLTRFQGENLFKRTISEFSSPWKYFQTERLHHDSNWQIILFFLLLSLCLLLLLATFRKRKLHEILLLAAFGWTAFSMVRNLPLFVLVSIPILASCLKDFSFPQGWNWIRNKKIPIALALLIGLFSLRVATNAYYVNDRRVDRFGWNLDAEVLPVRALEFLSQHHLEGRIINNLGFGGWLNWKGLQPTFIDGRLEVMEDSFFGEYLQSFRQDGLITLILKYQPQLILMDYNAAPSWAEQLRRFSDWRLIYLDECTAIYAQGNYAAGVPTLSFPLLLSERQIPRETDESTERLLKEIQPSALKNWSEGYVRPQRYSLGLSSMGLFALRAGEYEVARDFFTECLRRSGGGFEEIYFNLGVTQLRLKNYALGKAFLQCALKLNPKNPSTLQMLNSLKNY